MKKTVFIVFGAIIVVIIAGWFASARLFRNAAVSDELPVDIYYSENNGTVAPQYARVRTIELTRDPGKAVAASYTMKDGYGTVLTQKTLSVSPSMFAAILAGTKKVSPTAQSDTPCLGGGTKDLTVNIGSTTLVASSQACGPNSANESLESFYSQYLKPLISL